jgi:hypothetical protein
MAHDTITSDTTAYDHQQEAETIVREIIAVMTLRLSDAGKVFLPGALDQWRTDLLKHVKERLKHGTWEEDRQTVLAVAADMASIAILLAHKDDVDKDRVAAAFAAIKSHRRCLARGASEKVLGCWCDFCP